MSWNEKQKKFRKDIHRRLKKNPYYYKLYYGFWDRFRKPHKSSASGEGEDIKDVFATFYESEAVSVDAILYESFHGSRAACNPLAIFKAALQDERMSGIQHVWVLDPPAQLPSAYLGLPNVVTVSRKSADYARYLATAKIVVNNSTFPAWYVRPSGQVYLNTWHGTPLKKMFKEEASDSARHANSQRNFLQSTHIVLSGTYATDNLLGAADVSPLVDQRTYLTGSPRVDQSIKKRRHFKSDPNVKRVLYLPTWKGTLGNVKSQYDEFELVSSALLKHFGGGVDLYLKAHNFNNDDITRVLKKFGSATGANLFEVDEATDINDLMAEMDVVVTDYSSVMIDALAADIPVVLYAPDYDDYSAYRGLLLDLEKLPVVITTNSEELINAVVNAVSPSKLDHNRYQKARDILFPFEDGNATERVLDIMLSDDSAMEPVNKESKPLLAFMGGGWRRNGITTSMSNLLSNIDQGKYDVMLLTDGAAMKEEAWEQLKRVAPGVLKIHRVGSEGFTREETLVKRKFYSTNRLDNDKEYAVMKQAMSREWRRIVGDVEPLAAIDFSGYRRLWTWIIACANTDTKIIYQHNDLYSEMTKRFPELLGIFHTYQFFDYLCSVSEETRELNYKSLARYYGSAKSVSVRNTLNLFEIKRAVKGHDTTLKVDGKAYMPLFIGVKGDESIVKIDAIPSLNKKVTNFVCIGRFSDEKNHELLLRAFNTVVKERENVHLFILGEGPLFDQTKKLRDKLGLQAQVSIPGFTNQALKILDESDCFVLPSKYEGQPMVILEALTLNKPVIVTDIAGSRSALDGGYGHIVDENTPDSFAKSMIDFCDGKLEFKAFDADKYNESALNDFIKLL